MNVADFITVVVFLLFMQKAGYLFVKAKPDSLSIRFIGLSMFFSFWALLNVVANNAQIRDAVYPFNGLGLIAWSFLPILLYRFFSVFTNPRGEVSRGNRVFPVLLIAATFSSLSVLSHWLPTDGPMRLFSMDAGLLIFPALLLVLNAVLLISMLIKWKQSPPDRSRFVRFSVVFFPLVFFLGFSAFFEFILPVLTGKPVPVITPWVGIVWFPFLFYAFRGFQNARYSPANAGEFVLKKMKQPVFLCDTDLQVIRTNQHTLSLLGSLPRSVIGGDLFDFFRESDVLNESRKTTLENGHSGPHGLHLMPASGHAIPLQVHFLLVRDFFNDVHGLAVFCKDKRELHHLASMWRQRRKQWAGLLKRRKRLESELSRINSELAQSYRELQLRISESLRLEQKIESELSEREVLINEIHSRVIYNLNLIVSLVLSQAEGPFTGISRRKFTELAQRVRSILLVHEHLYLSVNYSEVDFSGFIRKLAVELLAYYELEGKVDVELKVSDKFIDIEKAIPMGIIANELLNNAFFHAWRPGRAAAAPTEPKRLSVGFFPAGKSWQLQVTDNGSGLPEDFRLASCETMGLPLVDILVREQLGGTMSFATLDGTSIRITFPPSQSLD
ncbi:MAG: histidine kinase dimerization/phosphoacceptor domain -containing protein [Bacteroidales bacterium]